MLRQTNYCNAPTCLHPEYTTQTEHTLTHWPNHNKSQHAPTCWDLRRWWCRDLPATSSKRALKQEVVTFKTFWTSILVFSVLVFGIYHNYR
jgi:hypothetical protein